MLKNEIKYCFIKMKRYFIILLILVVLGCIAYKITTFQSEHQQPKESKSTILQLKEPLYFNSFKLQFDIASQKSGIIATIGPNDFGKYANDIAKLEKISIKILGGRIFVSQTAGIVRETIVSRNSISSAGWSRVYIEKTLNQWRLIVDNKLTSLDCNIKEQVKTNTIIFGSPPTSQNQFFGSIRNVYVNEKLYREFKFERN